MADIIVTGATEKKHDFNLIRLLDAAEADILTLNLNKSKFKLTTLQLLGYLIFHSAIKPDLRRIQALVDLSPSKKNRTTEKNQRSICLLFKVD